MIELRHAGFRVERERSVCLHYRNALVGTPLRLDLLVDDRLVVDIKAVERLHPIHSAQVITYLKLSGLPNALLINFNTTKLVTGVKRLVHPALFEQPTKDESGS